MKTERLTWFKAQAIDDSIKLGICPSSELIVATERILTSTP